MARREYTEIDAGGVPVRISSPAKEYFPPAAGRPAITKLEGLGDAPWPPNFAKQPGEPKRVQASRARKHTG